MCEPTTVPFPEKHPTTKPWSPTDRDRLVFQWVKFDGHKQSWVAQQLDISQSTVSRMVDRYERWIARGGPALQGCLNNDERLRAQRWLTYERNEWILASALRIAGETERAIDRSKSTITKSSLSPSQELEVRTEHSVLDRSGIAARYLRLAYRINMDQLKLVEQKPLPALEPLSIAEAGDDPRIPLLDEVAAQNPLPPGEGGPDLSGPGEGPQSFLPNLDEEESSTQNSSLDPSPSVHQTHNASDSQPTASTDSKGTSANSCSPKKSAAAAFAGSSFPPEKAAVKRSSRDSASRKRPPQPKPHPTQAARLAPATASG